MIFDMITKMAQFMLQKFTLIETVSQNGPLHVLKVWMFNKEVILSYKHFYPFQINIGCVLFYPFSCSIYCNEGLLNSYPNFYYK